jgi:O-methyltransferase involved in polyketide biosynthesis
MSRLDASDLVGVSETLLVPLHYRVAESRSPTSTFKDETAERFYDSIAYDWSPFQGDRLQRPGMVARTHILDREVGAFIDAHPEALVVNLGAGLDTRFYRLDNAKVTWIEIDLPKVIAFREKLRESANPRHTLMGASVLTDDWIAAVKNRRCGDVLFVAEGLFPYFTETQHKLVFGFLADNFPGQHLLMQTSAPSVVQGLVHLSDLKNLKNRAELQWGLEEGADVSALNPKARLIGEYSLLEGYEDILPDELKQRLSPEMIRKAAKIIHVRFG